MITKNLLKYYLECLKYESYYSIQFTEKDYQDLKITVENLTHIQEQYENINNNLKVDHTILFGYPILKKVLNGKSSYYPLIIWNVPSFSDKCNPFLVDESGFHQELFKTITEKNAINEIHTLKEQFIISPQSFLENENNLEKLLDYTDYTMSDIYKEYVIFQAKSSNQGNYHISKEIQAMIDEYYQPSAALHSFLANSYKLANTEKHSQIIHLVPSNLPQNLAISDINNTISIIKGPPGTGKTQTILNLIATQVNNQETCIVSSTNNQAVNNIIEKLESTGISEHFFGFLRFGSVLHNKTQVSKIHALILAMKKEITNLISNKELDVYELKNRELMKKINEVECIEQQIVDIKNTIQQLQKLISILNDRLRINHLMDMKNTFIKLSISSEKVEQRLREIVDNPSHIFAIPIFRNFRFFIANKIHFYMKTTLKKYLNSIDARQLWEHIDLITPTQSLAICEEVIKVINLENRLTRYKHELSQLQTKLNNSPYDLKKLYKDKNINDLIIVRSKWLEQAKPILESVSEMNGIKNLIKELENDGRIRNTATSFSSFLKLFPVLLVSSLSTRNCFPHGALADLAIIDESSQCSIPSIFSILQSSKKACFFGDIHQLSHIVSLGDSFSKTLFNKYTLGIDYSSYCFNNISAFERAEYSCQHSDAGNHLLSYHYRCIPSIISFSNQNFYHGRLRIIRQEPERIPYYSGIFSKNVYGDGKNKFNSKELKEIETIVNKLESNDVTSIGIITPFKAQKNKLEELFREKTNIKIGTVHAFQGGECQAIIFSTVISDTSNSFQTDFVQNNYRLINVALTRALNYFILVGNLAKIDNEKSHLSKLSQYIYTIEASNFYQSSIALSIAFNQTIQQENRKALMHEGERMIYNKMKIFLGGMPLIIFPKVPIKDVLSFNLILEKKLQNYYFSSHMDFVIYEKESLQPLCSIEYDGNTHLKNKKTKQNDEQKDTLCKYANFKQFRISSTEEESGWEKLQIYLKSFL
ncbi:AAA domain-containing protein [Paenibacillus kyungheensis]